jgi:hypothetical protein
LEQKPDKLLVNGGAKKKKEIIVKNYYQLHGGTPKKSFQVDILAFILLISPGMRGFVPNIQDAFFPFTRDSNDEGCLNEKHFSN